MPLDNACVRDILSYIDSLPNNGRHITIPKINKALHDDAGMPRYEKGVVKYHVWMLYDEKYLRADKKAALEIRGLTEKGSALCASLKPKPVWSRLEKGVFLTLVELACAAIKLFRAFYG